MKAKDSAVTVTSASTAVETQTRTNQTLTVVATETDVTSDTLTETGNTVTGAYAATGESRSTQPAGLHGTVLLPRLRFE